MYTNKSISEVRNAWQSEPAEKPCGLLQKTDLHVKVCYTLTVQVTQGWHQLMHVVAHCYFFVFIILLAYEWEEHWPSHTATKQFLLSHSDSSIVKDLAYKHMYNQQNTILHKIRTCICFVFWQHVLLGSQNRMKSPAHQFLLM